METLQQVIDQHWETLTKTRMPGVEVETTTIGSNNKANRKE